MKFITLGIVKNGFYYIEKGEDEAYTFYFVDEMPSMPLDEKALRKFLYEHETEGYSCTGSWLDVMQELNFLLPYDEDDLIELNL